MTCQRNPSLLASNAPVARVGVGVMVKAGAPSPDVSTVDAFKRTVLAAKTVGYIDPASGGSSGIYLTKLWEQLGIADAVKAKAKLKQGGYVADLVVSGEAELGIHQISEIVTVCRRDAGRPVAGGNPELHGLCSRDQCGSKAAGCSEGVGDFSRRPGDCRGAQVKRNGTPAVLRRIGISEIAWPVFRFKALIL